MHEERLRILHEMKQVERPQYGGGKSSVHMSKNMRRIRRREKKRKMREESKKKRIKDLAKKRKQYGQYIKEFYLPKLNGKQQKI